MPFFAASEAPPRPESMKFPVFSLLAGNFGIFRDEFAADSPLQQRVSCEPDFRDAFHRDGPLGVLFGWTMRPHPCSTIIGAIRRAI